MDCLIVIWYIKLSSELTFKKLNLASTHIALATALMLHTATHCNTLQHTATHCNTYLATTHITALATALIHPGASVFMCYIYIHMYSTYACSVCIRVWVIYLDATHCNTLQHVPHTATHYVYVYEWYILPWCTPAHLYECFMYTYKFTVRMHVMYICVYVRVWVVNTALMLHTATHCNTLQHTMYKCMSGRHRLDPPRRICHVCDINVYKFTVRMWSDVYMCMYMCVRDVHRYVYVHACMWYK